MRLIHLSIHFFPHEFLLNIMREIILIAPITKRQITGTISYPLGITWL
jgi:hypothetical protein